MIDFTKPVQTRGGEPVQIMTTSGRQPWPIIGFINSDSQPTTWDENGRYWASHKEHGSDLVQVHIPPDLTKPLQTRSGKSVRLLCTDAPGEYPIVGLVDGRPGPTTWTESGFHEVSNTPCDLDLVNVEEPVNVEVPINNDTFMYLNVYKVADDFDNYGVAPHRTRSMADMCSNGTRVSCLRVQIKEGQFDD